MVEFFDCVLVFLWCYFECDIFDCWVWIEIVGVEGDCLLFGLKDEVEYVYEDCNFFVWYVFWYDGIVGICDLVEVVKFGDFGFCWYDVKCVWVDVLVGG